MNLQELDYILMRVNRSIDEICLVMNILGQMDFPFSRDNMSEKATEAFNSAVRFGDCLELYKKSLIAKNDSGSVNDDAA